MCVYIILMHGEKESWVAKDSPRTTAGELRENSWVSGSENLKKNMSNSPYITTCCLGGFQEKFSSLIQKQSPAYSVVRYDWNFKWDWLLWSDEKKMSFLAANTQMGLVNTGIKSTPCVQWNILLYFWCCGPIFLLEVLDILFRHMASFILSNTNR